MKDYGYGRDPTHQAFTQGTGPHVLMITNHGTHQWDVVPGLPDTGGQNLFVNMFTETLAKLGFRITIANRGGYAHPTSGEMQVGMRYKDARQRILYVQDDRPEFIRKEDMDEQTPKLAANLREFLESPAGGYVDLIVSHYWDGAKIGALVRRRFRRRIPHIWVPHSVGTVKKRNMPPETWADLRVDERIATERELIPELDGVAATSPLIRQALIEDYGVTQPLFLPPCIDPARFHPRRVHETHEIYEFLARQGGISAEQVRQSRIITEISRTDTTKRKDVLIRAFAAVHEKHPNTLLVVSIDSHSGKLHDELWALIRELGLASRVVVVGNIWESLPNLYAVTQVYCSPSVMEGFGMAVQEAAATGVPVVGSNLIPFVTEYLLDGRKEVPVDGGWAPIQVGQGGIVAAADDVAGFARAINLLLEDEELRKRMGDAAYRITIPYFTWDGMVKDFLDAIGFGEAARTSFARKARFHLDREKLEGLLQAETLEDLSVPELEKLFRSDSLLGRFLPDGVCRVDPRDGARIVFNAARAKRPHDNAEPPAEPEEDGSQDPVCRGETTGVIDVAPLSEGFTFINKNLFPVVYPFEDWSRSQEGADGHADGRRPVGLHFLQWTSSYFDRDWYNMPNSDRETVFRRLAALEAKLLLDDSSGYPVSGKTRDGRTTHGYVQMIKNHGRLVGGSLAHGHQQILYGNIKPQHFERNERFEHERGEPFSAYMLRENPAHLMVRDYGHAALLVPYFMRRPYNCLLLLKDTTKRHLHECDDGELAALARAWGEVTAAIMAIMPSIGKTTAYNVTISNGPGAGLYCEFLPYTQETGGFEHLGFWVCQDNPENAASRLRDFLDRQFGTA